MNITLRIHHTPMLVLSQEERSSAMRNTTACFEQPIKEKGTSSIQTMENMMIIEDEMERVNADYATHEKRLQEINSEIHEFLLQEANCTTSAGEKQHQQHWSSHVNMEALEKLRDEHNDIEDHLEQLEMKMRQLQDINRSQHTAVDLCSSSAGSSNHLYFDIDENEEDGASFACDEDEDEEDDQDNHNNVDCSSSVGSSSTSEESWDKNCSLGKVVKEDKRRRALHRSMSLPSFNLGPKQPSFADAFKAQQEYKQKQPKDQEEKQQEQEIHSPESSACPPSDLAPSTIDNMVTMLQRKTQETKEKSRTMKRRSSFNGFFSGFQGTPSTSTTTPPLTTTTKTSLNPPLSVSCSSRIQSTNSLQTLTSVATDSGTRPHHHHHDQRSYQGRRPSLTNAVRMVNNIVDDVIVGRNEEGEVLVDFPSRKTDEDDTNNKAGTPDNYYQYQNQYHTQQDGNDDNQSNCAFYGGCDTASSSSPTKSCSESEASPTSLSDAVGDSTQDTIPVQQQQSLTFFGLAGSSKGTSSAHSSSSSSKNKKATALEESYMKRMASMEATYKQETSEKNLKITQQQNAITTLETAAAVQGDTITKLRQANENLLEQLEDMKRLNAKLLAQNPQARKKRY